MASDAHEEMDLQRVWYSVPLVSPLQVCFSSSAQSHIRRQLSR